MAARRTTLPLEPYWPIRPDGGVAWRLVAPWLHSYIKQETRQYLSFKSYHSQNLSRVWQVKYSAARELLLFQQRAVLSVFLGPTSESSQTHKVCCIFWVIKWDECVSRSEKIFSMAQNVNIISMMSRRTAGQRLSKSNININSNMFQNIIYQKILTIM